MKKIALIAIFALISAILLSAVIGSSGCQKSSSTSTTTQNETKTKQPLTHDDTNQQQQSKAAEKVTVAIKSDGMDPQEVTVKAGGTVVWKNESGADAQIHVEELGGPGDTVSDGGTYQQRFDSAGSFSYHNHLSSSMTGTVTVE